MKILNKQNLFYIIVCWVLLIITIAVTFICSYGWFNQVYQYHNIKFSYDFYKMFINYVKLLLIVLLPIYLPFQTMLVYTKSKSIIAAIFTNVILIPIIIYLNYFYLYLNFIFSLILGIICIYIYLCLNFILKKLECKINGFIFVFIKSILLLFLSFIFILFFGIFLYTFKFDDMGYFLNNEYIIQKYYLYALPIILPALFVKPQKKSFLINLTFSFIFLVKIVVTDNSDIYFYVLYFFVSSFIIIIIKFIANNFKKIIRHK